MKWNNDTVRSEERQSIISFLQANQHYFRSTTLDYGCGISPYKEIVEGSGADYHGFDRASHPASVTGGEDVGKLDNPLNIKEVWGTILCTQVMQYVPDPEVLIDDFASALKSEGYLVMTYPTNWAEVEHEDFWRFTKAGMNRLLTRAGFRVIHHEQRAVIDLGGFRLATGYGVVGQRW